MLCTISNPSLNPIAHSTVVNLNISKPTNPYETEPELSVRKFKKGNNQRNHPSMKILSKILMWTGRLRGLHQLASTFLPCLCWWVPEHPRSFSTCFRSTLSDLSCAQICEGNETSPENTHVCFHVPQKCKQHGTKLYNSAKTPWSDNQKDTTLSTVSAKWFYGETLVLWFCLKVVRFTAFLRHPKFHHHHKML